MGRLSGTAFHEPSAQDAGRRIAALFTTYLKPLQPAHYQLGTARKGRGPHLSRRLRTTCVFPGSGSARWAVADLAEYAQPG